MNLTVLPEQGVLTDRQSIKFERPPDEVLANIWSIGGKRGWYKANLLWQLRGWLDELVGGDGMARGRRSPTELITGDTIDFWRVLIANKQTRHLLLFAEMKVPGRAWLEFRIVQKPDGHYLEQLAVFEPNGLAGQLYWFTMLPFHFIIFGGMARNIIRFKERKSCLAET